MEDGVSVKEYVRSVLGFSARTLKNAKYNGAITVNGVSVHTNHVLKAGDAASYNAFDDYVYKNTGKGMVTANIVVHYSN